MRTAELPGLTGAKPDPYLLEWDYGGYEGLTAEQTGESRPGWDLWRGGVIPGDADRPGERLAQVAARMDAVLDRVRCWATAPPSSRTATWHVYSPCAGSAWTPPRADRSAIRIPALSAS